jgi:hypothetical protein
MREKRRSEGKKKREMVREGEMSLRDKTENEISNHP